MVTSVFDFYTISYKLTNFAKLKEDKDIIRTRLKIAEAYVKELRK
jgi:hypothetical protein